MSTGPAVPSSLAAGVHSPCIGVCRLDEETGYCLGCGRTAFEVSEWASADDERKTLIWQSLPTRLEMLGTKVRLMPWSPVAVGDWVAERLRERTGTWIVGSMAASAAFAAGLEVAVRQTPTEITACQKEGAFRLELHEKLRAFSFGADPIRSMVVLALPRTRISLPVASGLTPLGPDIRAVDPEHRSLSLFDLGVGGKEVRICLRTANSALAENLHAASGQQWNSEMSSIDAAHLVVETALSRVEKYAPKFPLGDSLSGMVPGHLLEQLSNRGRDTSVETTLPRWAVPVAVYSPEFRCCGLECSNGVEMG